MKSCILLAIIATASAMCPNGCSGHGICGANDKCSCYQNFQGADCSLRTCPYTLAWADTADGTNNAHYYAECGNKGACDRKTGECKCFDGYEGSGCRRSTCPDNCGGHGTCEYIEELATDYQDRRNGPGNMYQDLSCSSQRNSVSGSGSQHAASSISSCVVTGAKPLIFSTTAASEALTDQATCGAATDQCIYAVTSTGGGPGCSVTGTVTTVTGGTGSIVASFTAAGVATTTDFVVTGGDLTKCTSAPTLTLVVTNTGANAGAVTDTGGLFITAALDTIHGTYTGSSGLTTSNVVARTANQDVTHGHLYQLWDAGKIQGCKCDLGYDGPDCAHRVSPHGDDPLTTVKSSMMKQVVQIGHDANDVFSTDARTREEFLMVYHDPYGGVWRTDGIIASTNDGIAASRVEDALRALPNEVLEGVTVKARTAGDVTLCTRFFDGVQHLAAFDETRDGHFKNSKVATNWCESTYTLALGTNKMDFTIEFADKPGQTGVQYLMEVDIEKRGAGSFPVSGGITGASSYSVAEMNFNVNLGNLSELSECSDRGLDDGDGSCECFDGFRGLACEEQEALV